LNYQKIKSGRNVNTPAIHSKHLITVYTQWDFLNKLEKDFQFIWCIHITVI